MERLRRPVEVSLELSSEYMDSSVSAVSSQNNSGDSDVVRFIQREVNVKGVIHSCPPSIAYLLCPTDPPSVQSSHGLLMELLKTQSVEIPRVEFKVEYEDEKAYYELINLSCNVDGCSSARVRSIEICRDYVSNQEAATLFSALPHARSLRVLRYKRPNFDVDRSNLSALMAPEWAWIGYALFHPATVTSTWRELQLEIIQISADTQRILTAMSQGNNLLAILNGTPAGNRAYFTTTLASGSSFVRNPTISALPIMQFDDMKTVDAVVTSTDLSPLDEFAPLAVPGLGLVYTRRDNVLQLTGRPASPVCLTALHFQSFDFYGSTTEQASGMLKLLGSKLEHLGIFGIENFAVEDLRQLLVLTPALQSLVTDAKCVLWSGYEVDEAIAAMPKLQELEIAMSSSDTINTPSELALCTYLRDLRALRVKVWEQADLDQHDEMVLPRSLGGILTILRGLPEFEYLHWYHFLHIGSREREIRRYAASRQCTWKKIGVGFSPSDREARFILPCGHAFLSAVHATPSTSTLGQFGQDILDLVLQFASVYRPRDITIKRRPLYTPPPNVPLVSAFAASTN
ncbi:hypothetical protein Poli38472_001270 [Pythium oligandrum]|uniref:Uncharacterized protein n=1 Tax=Pythium oligandrum TaxID=41045 RepID=A0A8K1CT72_PYTOL|nr:hypothetical protein Poli38472_001270 [Pythium oligandrum]|eukprot:TMW69114.1 hypothetical protein Poli38472_001270 [Pythium oligandrum]